jgi:hypothetical protein
MVRQPVVPPGPVKAHSPSIANGAINVIIAGLLLAWLGGQGNLYLGTDPNHLTREVISATSPVMVAVQLGALLPNTTYYWRVNVNGAPTGDLWSFTTAA